jgi:hypothetical protein
MAAFSFYILIKPGNPGSLQRRRRVWSMPQGRQRQNGISELRVCRSRRPPEGDFRSEPERSLHQGPAKEVCDRHISVPACDDYGSPVERIPTTDPRWSFDVNWAGAPVNRRDTKLVTRKSSEKGAEAAVTFEGTGAIVTGQYLPTGGRADVYLDGKLHRTVDVYPDENATKSGESVWHAFGQKDGKHTVRLVVRGEPYAESKGADIAIEDLIVFR